MRSLQQRLNLGIVTALAALLTLTALLAYPALRAFLRDEFDYALLSKARQLTAPTNPGGAGFSLRFTESPPPEFQPGPEAEYFEIRTTDGEVLARSASLGKASLTVRKQADKAPTFFNVKLPDARKGRAVALRLDMPGTGLGDVGFIAVFARDTTHLRESHQRALWVFLGGGGVVMGLAVLLVRTATRRGLEPLAQLAGQVGQIHARKLDTRLGTRDLPAELVPIVEQFNGVLARLEAAFERERRFSAHAAHELLTPVSELRAAAENATQCPDDPAATQQLATDTLDAARQMERLVRTLLTLANSDREDQPLTAVEINFTGLVQGALEPLGGRLAARQLTLETAFPEKASIRGDHAACVSIVQNLLDNAVEYTPVGGRIECRVELRSPQVALVVTNTNPGLDTSALTKLWEPFWRHDDARSDRTHAGLGLALVQALARAQKFELRACLPTPQEFQVEIIMPAAGPPA